MQEQLYSGIIAFLEKLRHEGYSVGVDTHFRVLQVMQFLAEQAIEDDADYEQKLMASLRGVLSGNAQQQRRFEAFFEANKDLLYQTVTTGQKQQTTAPTNTDSGSITPPPPTPKQQRRWWLWALAALAAMVLIAVLCYHFLKAEPMPNTPPVPNPNPNPTVDTAKPDSLKNKIDTTKKIEPTPEPTPMPTPEESDYRVPLDSITAATLPLVPLGAPLQPHWWSIHGRWILAALSGGLFCGALLWWLYRRKKEGDAQKNASIQLEQGEQPPYILPLYWDKSQEEKILRGETESKLYNTLPHLRGREDADIRRLNIAKTVKETIKNAGRWKLVYTELQRRKEYLILIDETVKNSHQTALFEYIYQLLLQEQVAAVRYFFYGNPGFVWNDEQPDGLNLSELYHKHSQAHLLVFANGYSFIHPYTGELQTNAKQLALWDRRALLTSAPTQSWSYKELILSQLLLILPAHIDGLVALVEHFEKESKPDLKEWKYQWACRQDAIRLDVPQDGKDDWDYRLEGLKTTDIDAPLCAEFKADLLRWFGGDETIVQWIAACALYPEVQWDLTLAIGDAFSTPEKPLLTWENLISINRLPWFSFARISDKYRLLLLGVLDKEKERRALAIINELLEGSIHRISKEAVAYHQAQMQLAINELLLADMPQDRRQKVEAFREVYGQHSREADFVSLRRLRQSQPLSRLSLGLPPVLRNFLFKGGDGLLGWSSRAVLSLCCFVAAVVLLFSFLVPQPERSTPICDKHYVIRNDIDQVFADWEALLCQEPPATRAQLQALWQRADAAQQKQLAAALQKRISIYYQTQQFDRLAAYLDAGQPLLVAALDTPYTNAYYQNLRGLMAFYGGDKLQAAAYRDSVLLADSGYYRRPPLPNLYHLLQYDFIAAPRSNMYKVSKADKYGFLDSLGKEIAMGYDEAYHFVGDSAMVKKDGKTYRIDKSGKAKEIADVFVLQGKVLDAISRKPLQGVKLQVNGQTVLTDAMGFFSLESNQEQTQAVVSMENYKEQTATIANDALILLLPAQAPRMTKFPTKKYSKDGKQYLELYMVFECGKTTLTKDSEKQLDSIRNTLQLPQIEFIRMGIRANDASLCESLSESNKERAAERFGMAIMEKLKEKGFDMNKAEMFFITQETDPSGYDASFPIGAVVTFWLTAETKTQDNKTPTPEMVFVQGDSFTMGCTEEQGGNCESYEKPPHKITLSDYYIGKYEVTFEEYDLFCEATQREKPNDRGWGRGKRPVMNVNWDDATAYCQWLSEVTGKSYSLPTEAQWEYAARGGNKSKKYKYAGTTTTDNLSDYAWYYGNSGNQTQEVGSRKANELGIYDMSGNVYEWCSDWYGDYEAKDQTNPIGAGTGSYRVLRGGGWSDYAGYCRVSYRYYFAPDRRYNYFGFRLVLVP